MIPPSIKARKPLGKGAQASIQLIPALAIASESRRVVHAELILSDSFVCGCLLGEMQLLSDAQVLEQYAHKRSETAFDEIVARHADLVYSAALRQIGSPEAARDITQTVFIALARKSSSLAYKLPANGSLAGWLYRSTRFAALNFIRDRQRRQNTERQAMESSKPLSPKDDGALAWDRIQPLLDAAVSSLGDEDRDALLMRFFRGRSFQDVGIALGISDDAAQKRVSRALEKLRLWLARRGVNTTGAALSAAIAAHAVQPVPTALLAALTHGAISAAATPVTTAMLTKILALTTLQKAVAGIVVIILVWAAGSAVFGWPPLWHYAAEDYWCASSLAHIEATKRLWALETGQTNGTPVDPVQLEQFAHTRGGLARGYPMPYCRSGGIYNYRNVGQLPTCSLGTNKPLRPVKERVGLFAWRWELHALTKEYMDEHMYPGVVDQLSK